MMSASAGPKSVDELPTPSLVLDGPTVRRNIDRLASYAKEHGLRIRPHTKTHKSRFIAGLQMTAGAIGLTVAKAGEAEQMAEAADDLLMAYPAVDPARCRRLAALARSRTVRVAAENPTGVEALAAAANEAGSTMGVLVELEVGMGRTGVATPVDALKLAQMISSKRGLRLEGILCYPGQIWNQVKDFSTPLAAVSARLRETIDLWRANGLEAKIVSGGTTPTVFHSHLVKEYTEIRPGTYVFNDLNTHRGGYCALEDCAARLVCTVISDTVKNQIVLDGGTKTFTSDLCIPARDSGHGYLVEYPAARISALSEEHGQTDVSQCERRPRVGERVTVIPNHICPCINLQDSIWWREADGSLQKINVDARGELS
jgi:D-serine deaminase-like pyridoxal phosphate-dependent protein